MGCGSSKKAQVVPNAAPEVDNNDDRTDDHTSGVATSRNSAVDAPDKAAIEKFLEDAEETSADPTELGPMDSWSAHPSISHDCDAFTSMEPIIEEGRGLTPNATKAEDQGGLEDIPAFTVLTSTAQESAARASDSSVSLHYLVHHVLPLVETLMEEKSLHDLTVAEFVERHVSLRSAPGCRCALQRNPWGLVERPCINVLTRPCAVT